MSVFGFAVLVDLVLLVDFRFGRFAGFCGSMLCCLVVDSFGWFGLFGFAWGFGLVIWFSFLVCSFGYCLFAFGLFYVDLR